MGVEVNLRFTGCAVNCYAFLLTCVTLNETRRKKENGPSNRAIQRNRCTEIPSGRWPGNAPLVSKERHQETNLGKNVLKHNFCLTEQFLDIVLDNSSFLGNTQSSGIEFIFLCVSHGEG